MEIDGSPEAASSDGGDGPASDAAVLYTSNRRLLLFFAQRWFGVPPPDAEVLVQDVFLSYLQRARSIREPRKWLIGAIFRASRRYWLDRSRSPLAPEIEERLDESSLEFVEKIADRLTVQQVFIRTPAECQVLLASRYVEGMSLGEIAATRDTTPGYAKKLVLGCLKRIRKIFHRRGKGLR